MVAPLDLVGPNYRPFKEVVLRNAARCNECGDQLESVHRHDFKECSCGGVMVDGGLDYVRRLFDGSKSYTDTSVTQYVEMSNEEIQKHHEWGFF